MIFTDGIIHLDGLPFTLPKEIKGNPKILDEIRREKVRRFIEKYCGEEEMKKFEHENFLRS